MDSQWCVPDSCTLSIKYRRLLWIGKLQFFPDTKLSQLGIKKIKKFVSNPRLDSNQDDLNIDRPPLCYGVTAQPWLTL